jgi:hypothetical protein
MRSHLPRVALGAGGLLLACTPHDDAAAQDHDGGGADVSAPADAGLDAAAEAATPQAFVRLAHWSPNVAAVDVCFAASGASFSGETPQLAPLFAMKDGGVAADSGDGGAPGLAYPRVTSYLVIPPGSYAVRLVAAGASDCNTSLADLASVTLKDRSYTTVAAVGEEMPVQTDQALKLVSLGDDVTAPSGQIALRFINASPQLASVDLGTGSLANTADSFAPLFAGVGFGKSATAAATDAASADANGYLALNPFAGASLSAHLTSSATDTVTAANVTINAQAAATIVIIGGITGNPAAPQLLQCADADDVASASLFAPCSVISQ